MTTGRMISIHHIDGNRYNDAVDNLILIDVKDPSIQVPVKDDAISTPLRSRMTATLRDVTQAESMLFDGALDKADFDYIRTRYLEARKAYHDLIKIRSFSD